MNNGAPHPIYSVDSSSLMDWQARHYPTDVFATMLARVDTLIAGNRFIAPALVREEIGAVGTAGLVEWADARPAIFVPTGQLLTDAQGIQNQFTGLRDPKAEMRKPMLT